MSEAYAYDHVVFRTFMDDVKTKARAIAENPGIPVESDNYMLAAMMLLIDVIHGLEVDLKNRLLDPTKLFDGVNRSLTDLEKLIAQLTAKAPNLTLEDAKKLVAAIKEFNDKIDELYEGIPRVDPNDPNSPIDKESDQYKVWEDANKIRNDILDTPVEGSTLRDYVLNGKEPDEILRRIFVIAGEGNRKEPPEGLFAKWDTGNGTNHDGFSRFGTKLTHLVDEYTDEAGKITAKMKVANDVVANITNTLDSANSATNRNTGK